jgi:acyl carrier protein
MIPTAVVALGALPLTPTGKVDRQALPEPTPNQPDWEASYVAPLTPTEERLAAIWSDVLGIERVGRFDHFFELGGHSLLATQLVARISEAFQVEMPLRRLFETSILATLAESIETTRRMTQGYAPPPIPSVDRNGTLPLSFAQERLWFLEQLMPGSSGYNLSFVLRLQGPLDLEALEQSLATVIQRHEALRTTFDTIEGQPIQVIAPNLAWSVPLMELQHVPRDRRDPEIQRLATIESQRPFDLRHGPLVRAVVLRLEASDHVLVLTMHHIVSDGWSMGILIREAVMLYQAMQRAQPLSLPPLPIQYADFATWQRQWLQESVRDTQLAYWRQQLAHLPMLNLPTDRPRPAIQTFRGASQSFALSLALTERLYRLSRQADATLFMTMASAFTTLLYHYTGQTDIVLGTPIANRTRVELEDLIGFFVNTLVLRTDLSGNPTFQELLGRVRQVCLEAYANQDLPFEQLVETVQPRRDLSRPPLFQVMLILQNAPIPVVTLPEGLTVTPIDLDDRPVRFDLEFHLWEEPDGLRGSLQYNTDLFQAATIAQLLTHFHRLLDAVTTDASQLLLDLLLEEQTEAISAMRSRLRSFEAETFNF